jgi:hypothetical protein
MAKQRMTRQRTAQLSATQQSATHQAAAEMPTRHRPTAKSRGLLAALAGVAVLVVTAATFISYLLWPTWPKANAPLDAPAVPVTVAGVLFNVPPAAIRAAVQRHPGAHERLDAVFLWPSLTPPGPDFETTAVPSSTEGGDPVPAPRTDDRLFVTIAGLDGVLAPDVRLRTIYPRYIEAEAAPGADGLAIVRFRADTPYEGEDLVYLADRPEQFFLRCSRPVRTVPGTCMQERSIDAAEITLRFPRAWLEDWRNVAAGFDRLMAQLHALSGSS